MNLSKNLFSRLSIPVVLFLFLLNSSVHAQSFINYSGFTPHWSVGAHAGSSLFFGDIKQYKIWPVSQNENEWRFGGGLNFGYQVSPVFGLRIEGLYGKLAGTRRESNRYFEANYIELNLNTSISIRNIISSYRMNQFWDVYIIFGLGLTNYNSELMELSTKKVLRSMGNGNGNGIGGRTVEGIMMGGLGLNFRISDKWNLTIESANRGMSSDLLDGQEGGFKYDIYNYTSLGLNYTFGKKKKATQNKKEEFNYFDRETKSERTPNNEEKEVQPAEIDMLFVAPPILSQPIAPPKEEKREEKIVAQVEIIEEPIPVTEEITYQTQPITSYGLEYRVQIRAKYGSRLSINNLSNTYNIPTASIRENTYNGFYIYTVGSFTTYDNARNKRNQLRNRNGIVDCFVVAFENGQRLNKLP